MNRGMNEQNRIVTETWILFTQDWAESDLNSFEFRQLRLQNNGMVLIVWQHCGWMIP